MIEIDSTPLITWEDWLNLPVEIRNEIDNVCGPMESDFEDRSEMWITIAATEDRAVGAHLYMVSSKTIYSFSTWVHGEFSRLGIAKRLWVTGLDLQRSTRVRVATCSEGGWRLVQRLRSEFKGRVQFHVKDVRAPVITEASVALRMQLEKENTDRALQLLSYAA